MGVWNENFVKGLNTLFFKHFEQYKASADWKKVATVVDSTSASEDYGWLTGIPRMREWIDERVIKALKKHTYTIRNKDWEATIGIDKNALEDDQYGAIKTQIQNLAKAAADHPNELVFGLLKDGETELCYDGQPFFDEAHPVGKTTISNIVTGTGTTLDQIKADFLNARKTLLKFKDDEGRPFHTSASGLLIVAPVDLQGIFEELLNATTIAGTSNVLKGAADLLVTPYLTDSNDWYLLKVDEPIKPIIFQERKPVTPGKLEEGSENAFMRKQYLYGVEARYNVGFGLWQQAVLVKNS